MKIQAAAKRRAASRPRSRAIWEPDFDHEAWARDTPPTIESCPEAFYFRQELIDLKRSKASTRKGPLKTLSVGALRKRLQSAGIRGRMVAQIAREIHAGPDLTAMTAGGITVMGWPVQVLTERYGKRVSKAVTRFVQTKLIVMDEAFFLMQSSSVVEIIRSSFNAVRKFNAAPLEVSQDITDLNAQINQASAAVLQQ